MKWGAIFIFTVCLTSVIWSARGGTTDVQVDTQPLTAPLASELKVDEGHQLKENCIRSIKPGLLYRINAAKAESDLCIKAQINRGEAMRELTFVRSRQELRGVTERYCRKKDAILQCMKNVTALVESCLNVPTPKPGLLEEYRASADAACFNNGERIAQFIEEGGHTCVLRRSLNVRECFVKAAQRINVTGNGEVDVLNSFKRSEEKQCEDNLAFHSCVLTKLAECPRPTAARFVGLLFKAAEDVRGCRNSTTEPLTQRQEENALLT